MAYEGLNAHTEFLKRQYIDTKDMKFLYVLVQYYACIKRHAKFKYQADAARAAVFEVNRPFAEGFFRSEN